MDLLLNTLTEWLKELLAGAIASNLTGMVDSVNTKVGDIAAQVGQTPQGWNSGIFSMIQNLSNNVILPIAGIILALVMTMEFIRIIMDKNNMHDFDTWSILMWVFKTACAILIVSNTWNIVMAVFDVSQTVVNNAAGMIVGNTDIELVTEGLEETLMAMELSSLIGLWFQSMIVGVTMHILSILAKQLNISPHQLSYVTHSGEGEGLLFYGSTILPFVDRFPKDTELYRIITTKPQEQAG